jgi:transcriptional regulator with XRE-family HTH domain
MLNRRLIKPLRLMRGLSQAALAEEVNITQGRLSEFETGRRALTKTVARRIERYLALGEQHDDEDKPMFVPVVLTNRGMALEPLYGPDGSLGIYRTRRSADAAASMLREIGGLRAYASPTWIDFAARAVIRRSGGAPPEKSLYFVDARHDDLERARAAAHHVVSMLDGLDTETHDAAVAESIAASARAAAKANARDPVESA